MIRRYFLWSLVSAWCMAIGLRMIVEIVLNGNVVYIGNSFDLFFDWLLLFILGFCLFVVMVFDVYKDGDIFAGSKEER